jgi:hypothetical protein
MVKLLSACGSRTRGVFSTGADSRRNAVMMETVLRGLAVVFPLAQPDIVLGDPRLAAAFFELRAWGGCLGGIVCLFDFCGFGCLVFFFFFFFFFFSIPCPHVIFLRLLLQFLAMLIGPMFVYKNPKKMGCVWLIFCFAFGLVCYSPPQS